MKNILDLPGASGVGSAEGVGDCTVGDGAKDGSTLDGEGNTTLWHSLQNQVWHSLHHQVWHSLQNQVGFGGNATLDGEGNATLGFGGNATLDGEGNATLDVEVNVTDGSIVGDGCGVGTGVKKMKIMYVYICMGTILTTRMHSSRMRTVRKRSRLLGGGCTWSRQGWWCTWSCGVCLVPGGCI